jgi:hypothetical protein
MADCQVTCITKPNVLSKHEHITHIGNPANNWVWPVADVIESIEKKTNTFFVIDPMSRKRSDVGVVREYGKNPYLRTYADGDWNNNLLSLNQCPLYR